MGFSVSLRSALIAGVLLLTSCHSALTQETVRKIRLNETTEEQIVQTYGQPKEVETIEGTGGASTIYEYREQSGGNIGPVWWANYAILIVELRDGRVNGYLFARTDGDSTTFDPTVSEHIVVGQTTENDLAPMLGYPHGVAMPNTQLAAFITNVGDGETGRLAWVDAKPVTGVFNWTQLETKMLVVHIGPDGKVMDKSLRTFKVAP